MGKEVSREAAADRTLTGISSLKLFAMEWTDLTADVSAAKSALDLFKTASALLPKGVNKDEIDRNLRAAEEILKRSDAKLGKELGFRLCQCEYPPRPTLWRELEHAWVCQNPACNHRGLDFRPGLSRA